MNITHIPNKPGVYLFKNKKGDILYVGKAKNLQKRVGQYFAPGSLWKQDMLTKAHHVDFIEVRSESEALYLEDNLIKTNDPEYNRLLKGDNSYIYLKITKESFPQLYLTRFRKNDGARYIGPKTNIKDLHQLMHYLRKVYQYRTMKKTEFNQGKLDSDFYFNLDKGRSVIAQLSHHPDWTPQQREDFLSDKNNSQKYVQKIRHAIKNGFNIEKSYQEYIGEYRQIINAIVKFFEGNTKAITKKITSDINKAIQKENYERCINLKNILQQVDLWTEKQSVVLSTKYTGTIVSFTLLENFWVIVVTKIFEGKIIDIIREKKKNEERTLSQMKSSLEKDLNIELLEHKSDDHQIILYSSGLKKVLKRDWKDLEELLEKFIQSYIASTTFHHEENLTQDLLETLQKRYRIAQFPYHIECIDISHLSGMAISGGLSCMKEGLLYKPGYRQYKIKTLENIKGNYSNDFLSLQEIIVRRFHLKQQNVIINESESKKIHDKIYPDLFILDGGKGQLAILYELLHLFPKLKEIIDHHTTFIALGKGSARKESSKTEGKFEKIYYFNRKNEIISKDLLYDQADRLLTKLRDEAHRFSNTYRKKRMSSEWK